MIIPPPSEKLLRRPGTLEPANCPPEKSPANAATPRKVFASDKSSAPPPGVNFPRRRPPPPAFGGRWIRGIMASIRLGDAMIDER